MSIELVMCYDIYQQPLVLVGLKLPAIVCVCMCDVCDDLRNLLDPLGAWICEGGTSNHTAEVSWLLHAFEDLAFVKHIVQH